MAKKFKTDLPHALREAGLIAAMHGSIRRARKYLDKSLAVAERQGHALNTPRHYWLGAALAWKSIGRGLRKTWRLLDKP